MQECDLALHQALPVWASRSRQVAATAVARDTSGMPPTTRYARSGDVSIAYQVVGEGPFDVMFVPAAVSHVELVWGGADLARSFGRSLLDSRASFIIGRKGGQR